MRSNELPKTIAAALALSAPIAAGAAEGGNWDWSITPYLWAASIGTNLEVDVPPVEADNTTRFKDIVSKLNGIVPLHLEGQGSEWGVLSDVLYLSVSQKHEGDRFRTDASQKIGQFELAATWNPAGGARDGFQLFGGLRYLWGTVGIRIDPLATPNGTVDLKLDKDFADLMLGARYTTRVSERWDFTVRGDGSWGSTDGVYGAAARFQYHTSNGAWIFGYRYERQNFGSAGKTLNIDMYGPEIAYAFRF